MLTLFLDEKAVREHLQMADLIPAMEKALVQFSTGQVTQPVRSGITVDPPGGFFFMMPAWAEGLGVKIVTLFPTNAERGLPTHMATILLADPEMDDDSAATFNEFRATASKAVAQRTGTMRCCSARPPTALRIATIPRPTW